MYILTREIKEYNQDGQYFVKAFKTLPTEEQLIDCGVYSQDIEHALGGGGRKYCQDQWFYLTEDDGI